MDGLREAEQLAVFLCQVRDTLGQAAPPPGLSGKVRGLVHDAARRPAEEMGAALPLPRLDAPTTLADGVRHLIARQRRSWRLRRAVGFSVTAAAAAVAVVAHLGWGYVRDSFRTDDDLARQSVRLERAHETGISGGPGDLMALLEEDPFATG